MIELLGVTKQYLYGARVLGIVDMKIEDGECIAVLGGDGDGKTTFLKVLAGVTESEGTVLHDSEEATLKTNSVIMQFDDLAVFKSKSIYNNLAYPLKLRKLDNSTIDKAVKEAAEMLSLTACLYSRAYRCTYIDKKRMAVARLFLRDANLLVLDQPTADLKRDEAIELWNQIAPLLYKKKKEGVSVVYSTSNRDEALSIADRIVVLHAGEVKQIGTPQEIFSAPHSVWAAEALDEHYNVQKAVLSIKNDALTLTFGENGNAIDLDASLFANKIAEVYIGKTVLVGVHSDGFANGGNNNANGGNNNANGGNNNANDGNNIANGGNNNANCGNNIANERNTEKVEYISLDKNGYLLHTESGLVVRSEVQMDCVCTLPNLAVATLFDDTNENSIMI